MEARQNSRTVLQSLSIRNPSAKEPRSHSPNNWTEFAKVILTFDILHQHGVSDKSITLEMIDGKKAE